MPVSNALFNKVFYSQIKTLPLSDAQMQLILADPTQGYIFVPTEEIFTIITMLRDSIKLTFLFGLCCTIVSGTVFWFVPWTPIVSREAQQQELRHNERLA